MTSGALAAHALRVVSSVVTSAQDTLSSTSERSVRGVVNSIRVPSADVLPVWQSLVGIAGAVLQHSGERDVGMRLRGLASATGSAGRYVW